LQEADLVNVSNDDDKTELVRRGIPAGKIIVLPYGLSRSRRPLFDAISSNPPHQPRVAFVGTFDARKGAREFPRILQQIAERVPGVQFRLIGTGGQYGPEYIRASFPASLRHSIEVIAQFDPKQLPSILADCSVGIFPSHMEGFGFGVLEMLAAAIPVVAYDAPGPPMMLPPEYLVPRGNAEAMSAKVIELLVDESKLRLARRWARERSQAFNWSKIAQDTFSAYHQFLSSRR
jgi:glycosyltransferase involved in cell wall biosynthesis